ncbi:MAG: long-chain fatty acid--CoA ligase [Lentimicrobiaceae bacterium]|nr:long-chain fatty acid--CoA ligase [Lentimicrobiaceae bacterium]
MYQDYISIIKEQAQRYKNRNALYFKNLSSNTWEGISWTKLLQNIEQVARALVADNLPENSTIGIFSQNMPEWTMSDLGIMLSRCISVPIYASESSAYAKYIIDEAEISHVFVGEQIQYDKVLLLMGKCPSLKKIIVYDPAVDLHEREESVYFSDFIRNKKDENITAELKRRQKNMLPDDIATIIYTSGTTGEPKGVILDQQNILNTVQIHDERLNVSHKDVSMCFLPLSHVFERFWTYFVLAKGMTNYFLKNPKDIIHTIREVKPTIMCAVPRFFEKTYEAAMALLETSKPIEKKIFYWALNIGYIRSEQKRLHQKQPLWFHLKYLFANFIVLKKGRDVFGGRIRFMPCAGAPLSDHIIKFFHSAGIFIMYGYGLTETSATVCCYPYQGFDRTSTGSLMPGVQVKIGENDEILVKGNGVTRGYYKKPKVTTESFSDGWFHTGDAGRLIDGIHLVVFDRIKDIIKTSSGKYIAPQKLELLVKNDPFFEQIAVIGNEKKYISAIIFPSFSLLEKYAEEQGIRTSSRKELVNHPLIRKLYEEKLHHLQLELAHFERIKKFVLSSDELSVETGEMTPTLKIKRKVLAEKYKEVIDSMYKEEN